MPSNNVVELIVRLQDRLSAPLEQINGRLETFRAGLQSLTALAGVAGAAAALGAFAKNALDSADAVGDAADRMGIAASDLSRLKYAADQSDVSFESLQQSIKLWQVQLSKAASGSKDAAAGLQLINLNAEELKSLTLEDQLKRIADQFARIRDPADQTRVAVELFGRAGEQLVPLLRKGGTAIEELTAKADELGITLNEQTATAADRTDKALKRLWATIEAGSARVGGTLALAILGPDGERDAIVQKIEDLKKQRDSLVNAGPITKFLIPNSDSAIKNYNALLDEQLRALAAFDRRAQAQKPSELKIAPELTPITDVMVKQTKNQLEGLAKLLDDFEVSTRTSEEQIYQSYKDTVAKIQEISSKLGADETAKRLKDARIKYEEAVTIDPVKISQSRVVVTQVLSEQQRAVNKFVDTLSTGLDNLAHSGELTGRSILKYLLASFEAQALKDAIDSLGSYLKKTLGGSTGSGSAGSIIGSVISGLFGSGGGGSGEISPVVITQKHAAGGGSMSGPKVVGEDGPELDLGGGSIMNRRQLQFAMAGASGINFAPVTNITMSTNATNPAEVAQIAGVVIQQAMRKQADDLNRRLKDNYGRGLR